MNDEGQADDLARREVADVELGSTVPFRTEQQRRQVAATIATRLLLFIVQPPVVSFLKQV